MSALMKWFTPPKSKSIWEAMWGGGPDTTGMNREKYAGAPGQQDIGNLPEEEAQGLAAKRAFRSNLYFTSPTGTVNTAPRRGQRLTGV
jgi:hypothetical protein